MNTLAVEATSVTDDDNNVSYREIHIFFKDKFQGDHHLLVFVEQGENDRKTKEKAKAKAQTHLDYKNANDFSIEILTEKEYQQSLRSQQQAFYVLHQNDKGIRNYIPVLAIDPEQAEEIFKQRVNTYIAYRIFSRQEFKDLLTDNKWKKFHLTKTGQN